MAELHCFCRLAGVNHISPVNWRADGTAELQLTTAVKLVGGLNSNVWMLREIRTTVRG
jgi:hypothetical protein